tara:strand:+ start:223 stop:648 length:426 start_codon:yes stop_codon:yes gene_type:complete
MDFLFYLSPQSMEIYQMVSRKIRVVENSPICKKHDIYGWFDIAKKTMNICTDRIVSRDNVKYYINETLLHESVHLSQYCKNKSLTPLGILSSNMNLSDRRRQDVESAVKLIGPSIRQIEMEAFWMEDKPNEVKYVMKKYCF